MKDIDSQVFGMVKTAVTGEYSDAFVTGEYVTTAKKFPCVSVIEVSNLPKMQAVDLMHTEALTRVEYEIGIYTRGNGKKKQGRKIFAIIDAAMNGEGFIRSFAQTIPNFADETVWRYVLRYYKTI